MGGIAAATAWTRRNLIFDSSPLTGVYRESNRYNTRRLVIAVPELEDFLVSGVFCSSDRDLLRFLRTQPGLSVRETDTEIRIDLEISRWLSPVRDSGSARSAGMPFVA
jgi:ferric-dicitrate binding protein FerR (iron transport regulator)